MLFYQKDIEKVILELTELINDKLNINAKFKIPSRYIALKLLEGDTYYIKENGYTNADVIIKNARKPKQSLARIRGKPADTVIVMERYAMAMEISQRVSIEGKPGKDWREKIDYILMSFISIICTFKNSIFCVVR